MRLESQSKRQEILLGSGRANGEHPLKVYLQAFPRTFLIVLAARVVGASIFVLYVNGMAFALIFSLLFGMFGFLLSMSVSFLLPLFFCKSGADFACVLASYLLLFGISETAHEIVGRALASRYATTTLLAPTRRHNTAVYFSNACGYDYYLSSFESVICGKYPGDKSKPQRVEAAPMPDCQNRKVRPTADGRRCFLPADDKPIANALVSYEIDGLHKNPKPLRMSGAFELPKNGRGVVITEIVDGQERILGRSFRTFNDGDFLGVDHFFGVGLWFGHSWGQFILEPAGMKGDFGVVILQDLNKRS